MKNNLYIEILRWAYDKRFEGFTEEELFLKFELNKTETLKKWYLHVFRGAKDNEDCLIGIYDYKNDSYYCCLTARGLSAAIDYLNLEEVQKTGRRAEKIAITAIVIGIVVGVTQILVQICF